MRLIAQLARLMAVAAVIVATLPAVASSDVTVKPTVTTRRQWRHLLRVSPAGRSRPRGRRQGLKDLFLPTP